MPTNKLWIEHTERAAWQSVEALREKLADAEARQARLAPPVEGWQSLLATLDTLRGEGKLPGETYAAMVRTLVSELGAALARLRELESERARGQSARPGPAAPTLETLRRSRRDEELGEPSRAEERLVREIRRRHAEFARDRGRFDPSAVLADVEARLGDLPDLDPAELADAAADLAALALCVARAQPSDD